MWRSHTQTHTHKHIHTHTHKSEYNMQKVCKFWGQTGKPPTEKKVCRNVVCGRIRERLELKEGGKRGVEEGQKQKPQPRMNNRLQLFISPWSLCFQEAAAASCLISGGFPFFSYLENITQTRSSHIHKMHHHMWGLKGSGWLTWTLINLRRGRQIEGRLLQYLLCCSGIRRKFIQVTVDSLFLSQSLLSLIYHDLLFIGGCGHVVPCKCVANSLFCLTGLRKHTSLISESSALSLRSQIHKWHTFSAALRCSSSSLGGTRGISLTSKLFNSPVHAVFFCRISDSGVSKVLTAIMCFGLNG